MRPLLESRRQFRLWSARVGHGELLLRSTRSGDESTRIDVLFNPVSALKLATSLDGLVVRHGSADERAAIEREVGRYKDDEVAFVVESAGFSGYVVAATFAWHEDDGEYNDPSYFEGTW